jgi:hypothetical protein
MNDIKQWKLLMFKQILFNKQDVKLLAICCTFRRPNMLKEMIETFKETKSEGTELLIYLHEDDPCINDYFPVVKNCNYILDAHRMLCKVMNYIVFEVFPEISYYHLICDDHRYRTKGWDNILTKTLKEKYNDIGFTCGADLINAGNWYLCEHPSAEMWSWKFVKALGYVHPRDFDAFGGDFYTKDISKSLNALNFVPEVVIEHLWYGGCGKKTDKNIEEGYSLEAQARGTAVYEKWVKEDRENAIKRVKEAFSLK